MSSQRSTGTPQGAAFNLSTVGLGVAAWLRRPIVTAALLLTALTVMLTWPQALHLGSYVSPYPDPRLSIWRLSWLAHALKGGGSHLFDGNIFYPNPGTFAYSDATFLEGLVAAPWLWAHVNPVAVYNVLLLAGIVSSGIGMFVLVRYLTDNLDAALVSATIFTLVPYRVEHFMHLELQWTIWMPLSMWAVHRAFDRGSLRSGQWAGLLLALQVLPLLRCFGLVVSALAFPGHARPERPPRNSALASAHHSGGRIALFAPPAIANAKHSALAPVGDRERPLEPSATLSAAENWLWGWTAWGSRAMSAPLPGVVVVARRRRPWAGVVVRGFTPPWRPSRSRCRSG